MSTTGGKQTLSQSAARGKTIVRATGADTSSYGSTGTENISNANFKGGPADLSRSLSSGSVPGEGGK